MPRAWTNEEVAQKLIEHVRCMVSYWGKLKTDPLEAAEGVAFSILVMIDGESAGLPPMDLVLRPHESDQKYHEDQGENWFEPGGMANDIPEMLHDRFLRTTHN